MKLIYTYTKEEDVWCLLNKGKGSYNSAEETQVYKELVAAVGEHPTEADANHFIDNYLTRNNYNITECIDLYQKEWDSITDEFARIAEKIFGVSLKENIHVYLTVNNRCPYSIQENLFFVSFSGISPIKTAMHELWHFYTWYRFGEDEQKRLGYEKYNDIKESLTILLNTECKHLLPSGVEDTGYPQHKEMREKIIALWKEKPDIEYVWKELTR